MDAKRTPLSGDPCGQFPLEPTSAWRTEIRCLISLSKVESHSFVIDYQWASPVITATPRPSEEPFDRSHSEPPSESFVGFLNWSEQIFMKICILLLECGLRSLEE